MTAQGLSAKRKGISERLLSAGAASGDAGPLFDHLASIGFDEARPAELVDLIRRAGGLGPIDIQDSHAR